MQRSLDMLKNDKLIIENNSAKIRINDKSIGKSLDYFSIFLYERVPAMKYHNPDLSIECTRYSQEASSIAVDSGDGQWKDVSLEGKTSQQLVGNVIQLTSKPVEIERTEIERETVPGASSG